MPQQKLNIIRKTIRDVKEQCYCYDINVKVKTQIHTRARALVTHHKSLSCVFVIYTILYVQLRFNSVQQIVDSNHTIITLEMNLDNKNFDATKISLTACLFN